MKKIRFGLIVFWMLTCSVTTATAEVNIGIGLPNVSIGINLPLFPELVPVPGYPVYYAPQIEANYFFYDGMYWVYQNDNWYASSWYNGPWSLVDPYYVPVFVLRVPVHYYRQPPTYFSGWQSNAPPRWGQHWGHGWEQRRSGWDHWQRRSAPAPAPLPVYQRQYSGDRYPSRVEQQHELRSQSYHYQPRDKVVRQHFQQTEQKKPAPAERRKQDASKVKQDTTHAKPFQQKELKPAFQQRKQKQEAQEQQQKQKRAVQEQKQHKQQPVAPQQKPQPAAQQQRQQPAAQQQRQQPAAQQQRQQPATQQQKPQPAAQQQKPQPAAQQHRPQPAAQQQKQQPAAQQQKQQQPKPQGHEESQPANRGHGFGQNKD